MLATQITNAAGVKDEVTLLEFIARVAEKPFTTCFDISGNKLNY